VSVPSSTGGEVCETSAFNTQTPWKYPEDNLSLLQNCESLKTSIKDLIIWDAN
jgi:hypothetical protein